MRNEVHNWLQSKCAVIWIHGRSCFNSWKWKSHHTEGDCLVTNHQATCLQRVGPWSSCSPGSSGALLCNIQFLFQTSEYDGVCSCVKALFKMPSAFSIAHTSYYLDRQAAFPCVASFPCSVTFPMSDFLLSPDKILQQNPQSFFKENTHQK